MADEVVNPASADAAVIKSAEEAVGQALAARTAYDAQAAAAAATIAELKAQVAALSAPAPAPAPTDKLDAVERFMVRERHASRLDALRRMGAEGPFSDAQLLALSPDVDVKEADGLAKLEEWRKANLRLVSARLARLERAWLLRPR